MKTTLLWLLAVVNAGLFLALVLDRTPANAAHAQAAPRVGEVLSVPGSVVGVSADLLHVLDTNNGVLTAMAYNPNTNQLEAMIPLDLNAAFEQALSRADDQPRNNRRNRGY